MPSQLKLLVMNDRSGFELLTNLFYITVLDHAFVWINFSSTIYEISLLTESLMIIKIINLWVNCTNYTTLR